MLCLAFALALIFIWVPLDTGSGLVEKVRRKLIIGDALAPTVAGAILMLGAILLWLRPSSTAALSRTNWIWIVSLLALFALSLLTMRYAGPLLAAGVDGGYRPLRATPPWSYLGFVLGGTMLIGALTGLVNRQQSLRDYAIGLAAALVIALLYDLPFDDLILPPNGDI